jgi:hypothetical protein
MASQLSVVLARDPDLLHKIAACAAVSRLGSKAASYENTKTAKPTIGKEVFDSLDNHMRSTPNKHYRNSFKTEHKYA